MIHATKKHGVQSRKNSLIESLTNVFIGYVVALMSQLLIFPIYGGTFTFEQNLYIGLWFTLVSVVRSYVIRRWFTKKTEIAPYKPVTDIINKKTISFEQSRHPQKNIVNTIQKVKVVKHD